MLIYLFYCNLQQTFIVLLTFKQTQFDNLHTWMRLIIKNSNCNTIAGNQKFHAMIYWFSWKCLLNNFINFHREMHREIMQSCKNVWKVSHWTKLIPRIHTKVLKYVDFYHHNTYITLPVYDTQICQNIDELIFEYLKFNLQRNQNKTYHRIIIP